MIFMQLLGGRKAPQDDVDKSMSQGPVFGPIEKVYGVYQSHLKVKFAGRGDFAMFWYKEDCLLYRGIFYGDWVLLDASIFEADPELRKRQEVFNQMLVNSQ